jgi:hypothetical protein
MVAVVAARVGGVDAGSCDATGAVAGCGSRGTPCLASALGSSVEPTNAAIRIKNAARFMGLPESPTVGNRLSDQNIL